MQSVSSVQWKWFFSERESQLRYGLSKIVGRETIPDNDCWWCFLQPVGTQNMSCP